MEKKYKYIHIKQVDKEEFLNHPVYRIFNNRNNTELGLICWYKPWKEFVFSGKDQCVFNDTCLTDVLNYLKELKQWYSDPKHIHATGKKQQAVPVKNK